MATIVIYNTRKPSCNGYPNWILSPPFPGPCCVAQMERVGDIEAEDGSAYYYRRCSGCGYTVRHFLSAKPVEGELLRFLETLQEHRSHAEGSDLRELGARPWKSSS